MAKIRALQGIHPQVGMLLLRLCCMPLLNYLAQVVPPSLAAEHFEALTRRSLTLCCAEDKMRAFRRRLRLPMRHNGAGLIGVDSISAAAFTGFVVASAYADPILHQHLDGLSRFAQPALAQLQARFAPLGADASNTLLKLPMRCPTDLLDPSRYVEPVSNENLVIPKLQQRWSRSVHEAAWRTLGPDEDAGRL